MTSVRAVSRGRQADAEIRASDPALGAGTGTLVTRPGAWKAPTTAELSPKRGLQTGLCAAPEQGGAANALELDRWSDRRTLPRPQNPPLRWLLCMGCDLWKGHPAVDQKIVNHNVSAWFRSLAVAAIVAFARAPLSSAAPVPEVSIQHSPVSPRRRAHPHRTRSARYPPAEFSGSVNEVLDCQVRYARSS